MRLHLDRPAVVCAAAVSLVTAVAAVAPSTARADDTLPTQLPSVASLADAATAAATEVAATAAPPDSAPAAGAAPALDPVPAAESPETTPSDPSAPSPADDTAAPQGPQSADAVTQTAPASDITPSHADTVADTPAGTSQPAQPKPTAASVPAQPQPATTANINVSVRIDSPGDNGAVSQVNVAASPVAPLSTAPEPTKTASPATKPAVSQSAGGASSAPVSAGGTDTWYWNWDCLGSAPVSAISPAGSGSGSFPTSWTWIWNCGNNSAQYQSETPSGYQQINTNIAIRISSPGNDGSVTQVNVGAGIAIPLPAPVHGAPFPPSPASVPPPLDPTLGAVSAVVGPLLTATTPVDTSDITTALAPLAPNDASTAPVSATSVAAPVAEAGGTTVGETLLGQPAGGLRAFAFPSASSDRLVAPSTEGVDAAWHSAASIPVATSSVPTPARPPEASPRPRAHHVPGTPVRSDSGLSATAAASGVGGSPGSGGLPLLLALPFVAALLDLARRVALEHATWPTGHRRRAPERPG